MTNYIQAIPTEHGLDLLKSEFKDKAKTYVLMGAVEHDAPEADWAEFDRGEIASSFHDEYGVLTFTVPLSIEQDFQKTLHQILIVDDQNKAVTTVATPKLFLAKGIGGLLTIKVGITGTAGEIVFKSSEYVTEPELESIWLSPLYEAIKQHTEAENPHPQYFSPHNRNISDSITGSSSQIYASQKAVKSVNDKFTSLFASSKGGSGFQKLPNGLILQWFTTSSFSENGSGRTIVLPVTFPNGCLTAFANDVGAGSWSIGVSPKDRWSINVYAINHAGSRPNGIGVRFLAIGY